MVVILPYMKPKTIYRYLNDDLFLIVFTPLLPLAIDYSRLSHCQPETIAISAFIVPLGISLWSEAKFIQRVSLFVTIIAMGMYIDVAHGVRVYTNFSSGLRETEETLSYCGYIIIGSILYFIIEVILRVLDSNKKKSEG